MNIKAHRRRRRRRALLTSCVPVELLHRPIVFFAAALMVTAVISSDSNATTISLPTIERKLSKHHHNHKQKTPIDYTKYSCDALSTIQAKYPKRFDKCEFAHNCNEGGGILFPSLFCANVDTPWYHQTYRALLLVFLSLSLLLLFRLLSSTTDEFFSPGLELFSLTLGLPPRFAGVTLLALGNGAPDVAATMNAILVDERRGYEMALGELTGVSMFVTSVILGVIVSLSGADSGSKSGKEQIDDGEGNGDETAEERLRSPVVVAGVPCQGPLLRDISVLILVCVVSLSYLKRGVVDYGFVYTLLGMYGAYVVLVLGADAYHIFSHAPSLLVEGDETSDSSHVGDEEMIGQQKESKAFGDADEEVMTSLTDEQTSLIVSTTNTAYTRSDSAPQQQQYRPRSVSGHHNYHFYHHNSLPAHSHSLGFTVMEAISNYSCNEQGQLVDTSANSRTKQIASTVATTNTSSPAAISPAETSSIFSKTKGMTTTTRTLTTSSGDGWAPVQDDGMEPLVIFHPHHAVHPHHGPGGLLFLRSKSTGSSTSLAHQRHSSADDCQRQHLWSQEEITKWHSLNQSSSYDASSSRTTPISVPIVPSIHVMQQHGTATTTAMLQIAASSSSNVAEDGSMDNPFHRSNGQNVHNNSDIRPNGWREACSSNLREFRDHWRDFFTDIYRNEENSVSDVILLSVELPFTIVRKLTNPVPCDGYYCRPLVATSLALSPLWLWYYFLDQFGINIFSSYLGHILSIVALTTGLTVMRYAPGGEGPMDLWMVVPLTLYGFTIAATWLDSIAGKLVQLLDLFGILLQIPATVMGLMVLAPGNSLQDLVANVSLSKKGLSTMATTACLAGPIFNLCVGLGLGFWALMKNTGKGEIRVELPANIATGFYFTIANCALIVIAGRVVGKGVIGRGYGYVACGLYVVYVLTSLHV
mmetsp:Transcript_14279/g.25484  ORF Transcript_14279/g.25484 Transcript_14279/m.25484 type:complete len:926 (-) Transcript_14279:264-3041(-)|eukprot:CAMPEP_0196140472 /NCGR_PEP_ID=MMETSP0910-20130528/7369_1 /TAXON_ID=49265 /ORGANISM="Thalassiosira rotula, Strain GSO102" /LENGTH=925 /DNA_ID=CAMNT_0041401341 /DNA_START=113 /DNA_END=2890 /DNA_ORIENTATION=-